MNVRVASFYEERGCIRSENRQFSNKQLCYKYGGGEGGGGGGDGCHLAHSSPLGET